jgi:succinyl-diaminopimelate desuccinylase
MNKDEKINILKELIQMKTINNNEHDAAQYVKELFDKQGIESNYVDHGNNRSSLVVEIKGNEDGKNLTLSGHFDVVAVENKDDWSYGPFAAEIEGGKLYGRGAADMKAGLAAQVISLLELKEEGAEFNGILRFLGTAGEEVGMVGSKELARQGYAEDMDALLLAEPSAEDHLHYAHKGTLNYKVTSLGETGHSSNPSSGINAIIGLNEYINLAKEEMQKVHDQYENDVLGPLFHSVTGINGGGQENSLPGKATLTANVRTIPEFSNEQVIEKVEEMVEQLNGEIEGTLEFEVTQDSKPFIANSESELIKVAQKVLGDRPLSGIGAVTDAASFAEANDNFDLVMWGPGDASLAHEPDEHVEVETYLQYIDDLKEIILTYLNEEDIHE